MDSRRAVLVADFTESGPPTNRRPSLLYFHSPKDLELKVPAIRIKVTPDEGSFLVTLEADVLAKNVYLSLARASLSDNFFDLLPGRPFTVRLVTDLNLDQVEGSLKIRTLAEVPREGLGITLGIPTGGRVSHISF
jgi:beta-mannosidase